MICRDLVDWDLVATTVASSAAGVELPTDDCRQPAGITDENSFFLFFYGGSPFFGELFFEKKMALSTQKMVLFCIYFSSALSSLSTSSAPCSSVYRFRFSDCSLTVPFHHGLPQNEVVMDTNSFFHSWLCQSVPVFVVYPPCDAPHMLSYRDTCHYRTQLLGEPCQVVKQSSSG